MGEKYKVLNSAELKRSTITNIGWFKHYKPEEEKIERKLKVKETGALKYLREAFKKCKYTQDNSTDYNNYFSLIKEIKYTTGDIENFSLTLLEFQEEKDFGYKVGLFLSALIDKCNEQDFTVVTRHLTKSIYRLGYENTKNIIINGDAGYYVGANMKGGSIIINGNVESDLGENMKGGEIIVNGNAGGQIGIYMEGGSIHLNNDYSFVYTGAFDFDSKRNVCHKGNLIIKDGKLILSWGRWITVVVFSIIFPFVLFILGVPEHPSKCSCYKRPEEIQKNK